MAITPCMAHAQSVLNVRTISLAAAQEAALDQCRKNGVGVTVTLLDCRGRTKVMLHDGDANPHTSKQPAQGVYKYKPHYPRTSRGVRQAPDRRSEIGRGSQSRKHDLDRGWAADHGRQGLGQRLTFPALPAATRTRCARKPASTTSQKASPEVERGHQSSVARPVWRCRFLSRAVTRQGRRPPVGRSYTPNDGSQPLDWRSMPKTRPLSL